MDQTVSHPVSRRQARAGAASPKRRRVADLALDDVVTGHRLGRLSLQQVYLQCLRELAHHCGHADILGEQIVAAR